MTRFVLSAFAVIVALVVAPVAGCPAPAAVPSSAPAPAVSAPAAAMKPADARSLVVAFDAAWQKAAVDGIRPLATAKLAAALERQRQGCKAAVEAEEELPAGCDADPVLCAQDDVKVAAVEVSGDGSTLTVTRTMSGGLEDGATRAALHVVYEVDGWKIEQVRCLP